MLIATNAMALIHSLAFYRILNKLHEKCGMMDQYVLQIRHG